MFDVSLGRFVNENHRTILWSTILRRHYISVKCLTKQLKEKEDGKLSTHITWL